MTTITLPRATVEQALEALRHVVRQAQENLVPTIHYGPVNDVMNRLEAALAQQAEPVEPVGYLPTYELNRLQSGHDGRLRSAKFGPSSLDGDVALYTATPQRKPLTEEQAMLEMWQDVPGAVNFGITPKAEPPCPDCHGIGYDASGQTCWCQENPSF